MKHVLLSTIMMLFCFQLLSQIQWENVPFDNQSTYIILAVVDTSDIYALQPLDQKIMVSKDNGRTWDEFYSGPLTQGLEGFGATLDLRFDREGNLYWYRFSSRTAYKYDITNKSFTKVGPAASIDDFNFLDNGNILVVSGGSLVLYDENWEFIKQHTYTAHRSKILIGEGDQHFMQIQIGAITYLMGFNSDLTEFTSVYDAPPLPSLENYIYKGGRLFTREFYSDNGMDWYPLPNVNEPDEIFVNNNNSVFIVADDYYYYSSDNGETFDSLDYSNLPDDIRHAALVQMNENNQVFFQNRRCEKFNINVIKHNSLAYQDISHRFNYGPTFAEKVVAADKENIFVYTCDRFRTFKPNAVEPWQPISRNGNGPNFCSYGEYLEIAPNKNIISSTGCVSTDGGFQWAEKLNQSYSTNKIYIKSKEVYLIEHVPYISTDMGNHFNYFFVDTLPEGYYTYLGVLPNQRLLAYDPSSEIYVTLNKQDEVTELNINVEPINQNLFATGFEENIIYYLSYGSNNGIVNLNYSADGQSWNSTHLDWFRGRSPSIYVDHLENIYVYSDRVIGMSQDGGQTWTEITPTDPEISTISSLHVSQDNYIFVSTFGKALFRSTNPLRAKNELRIVFFEDQNENCSYDQGETLLPGFRAQIAPNSIYISDKDGEVNYESNFSELTVTPLFDSNIFESCIGQQTIQWTDVAPQEIYFPITYKEECAQIELGAFSSELIICDTNEYQLSISNTGSSIARNLQIEVELDSAFEYVSSDFDLIQLTGNNATLALPDILPGEKINGKIYFYLSCDADHGQEHCLRVMPTLTNACINLNSRHLLNDCVNNSTKHKFNDKEGLSAGNINYEVVDDAYGINYEIRFQNTSNDTVKDLTLSDVIEEYFTLESLYPISASHDYHYKIEHRELIVEFPNINLVPNSVDESKSKGYFKFQIKVDPSTAPGHVLNNTAVVTYNTAPGLHTDTTFNRYICYNKFTFIRDTICEGENHSGHTTTGTYFDRFKTGQGCDSARSLILTVYPKNHPACIFVSNNDIIEQALKVIPNPFTDNLTIKSTSEKIERVDILNASGQHISSADIDGHEKTLKLSNLAKGIYFIVAETINGNKLYSRLVKQ